MASTTQDHSRRSALPIMGMKDIIMGIIIMEEMGRINMVAMDTITMGVMSTTIMATTTTMGTRMAMAMGKEMAMEAIMVRTARLCVRQEI